MARTGAFPPAAWLLQPWTTALQIAASTGIARAAKSSANLLCHARAVSVIAR
jgi:hypothetical protein